jgi:predicted dehydrogenase
MLHAALIGFGGIAQAHKNGYAKLEQEGKVKLVAVCDIRKEVFEKAVEINLKSDTSMKVDFHAYTDLEEMLANEQIDFIDICLPTFLHKEYAIRMMERGYHVLCEKPMSLNFDACQEMLEAEKRTGEHFMIAQCLRFFPDYEYLKECMTDNRFGKVLSAQFSRISPPPVWGWQNWFMNPELAGGCITDMHIHDIDIARYLFGEPEAVSCRAGHSVSQYDTVQTALFYGGTPVTAIGDWTLSKVRFCASYRVDFKEATVIMEGGKVTVYPKGEDEPFAPELKIMDGYTAEISYFCDVILGKTENTKNPASSAARSIRLIELMKKSADMGGEKLKFEF